jgi:hypothetical protein
MPGLPEAIVDVLTTEALARSRLDQDVSTASERLLTLAQGHESALRLARVRLLRRASEASEGDLCRRAVGYCTAALERRP